MFEKMKEIIAAQLDCSADDITMDTNFKDDLGADSLDLYSMIQEMEEEYDIEIPEEDMEKMATVSDVINYLASVGIED